jgi:tRNA(Ile)-lysidine synthase
MTLQDAVLDVCDQQGFDKTYWVAYSGGLDSHVLLALFHELKQKYPIQCRVIHINHGISPRALDWALHCEQVCKAYQLDFQAEAIHLALQKGESLEEAARTARYGVFADCLAPSDVLVTAHHQDDQAETLLVQLLRGAGPKGLAGMPAFKPFAIGFHARPLLSFSREDLREYAVSHGLQWIEDESNEATAFTRNFIRQTVLASLKTRWPGVAATLARSASHCAEAQALLEEYVVEDWKNTKGSRENALSVQALLQLPPARQRLVLRSWIEGSGYGLPDSKKIKAILEDVLNAAWDRFPLVCWKGVELRRYRDDLFLMPPLPPLAEAKAFSWDFTQALDLSGVGTLQASLVPGVGLTQQLKQVTVQFRRGGEVIKLAKRGHRTLKNLLQEADVLPWLRDRIPLLFDGDQLVGVVGIGLHGDYRAQEGELGWEVRLL